MEESNNSVSIIVPVYNAEATLERCIDSILAQTYTNWELILVDDGSRDRSAEICDSYAARDSRIRVIHKPNGGVSSARNAGLDAARGCYIAFADADDVALPEWIQCFKNNIGDSDICVSGIRFINTKGESSIREIGNERGQDIRVLVEKLVDKGVLGYLFGKIFRRDIVEQNGVGFNSSIHFREDDLFVLKYLEYACSYVSVSDTNYDYIVPDESKTYKSSATECTELYFKSLLKIYNGNLSKEICQMQAWSVKGYAIDVLLSGGRLTKEFIRIYRNVFGTIVPLNGINDKIVKQIVCLNATMPRLSGFLIRIIHMVSGRSERRL